MIVVTTPTGKIGSQLVSHLLAASEEVRVVARNPAKLPPNFQGEVEIVEGSNDDPAVLDRALDGAEALFWLVPPPFDADDVMDHYLRFTRPAADAIRAKGVKRVVAVSGLYRGVERNDGADSPAGGMDKMIENTGVDYRALWSANLMENMFAQIEPIKHQGAFFLPVKPDVKLPLVATGDIAAMASRLLLDHAWTGQGGVAVLGPEDLSHDDMAGIMTEVLGMSVRFQQVPGDAFKEQLAKFGASDAVAQWLVGMFAEAGEQPYGGEVRTADNTTPTSFRSWCEQMLRPAVAR